MNSSGPLGVGVIGLGVGEQHARTYAAMSSCRLLRVYDLNHDRARRVANDLHTGIGQSEADIFDDPDIDVVSIASFDDDHCRQVLSALAARKHAFVEKPLCRSAEELMSVKAAWATHPDRHVASNLVLRAAPLYQRVRALIESGGLGEIYAFDGDYLYGRLQKITEGWRASVDDYSVMLGGGVHLVDLMMWLTGERPGRVSAQGNRISSRETGFRYHDFVAATYEFASGIIGRITANFGCVHRHQHSVRIFGTLGTFIYDDAGARLHRTRDAEAIPDPVAGSPQPPTKGALIPKFIASIEAGCHAGPILQTELDLVAACIGADLALASGSPREIIYV